MIVLCDVKQIKGQCIPVIPNFAVPIDVPGINNLNNANNGFIWVCEGIQVEFHGEGNTIYIEDSALVQIFDGDSNVIYVKSKTIISIFSEGNTVYHDIDATVQNVGPNNTIIPCPNLTFDYSEAPVIGCDVNTSLGKVTTASISLLNIYPNPTKGEFTIELDETYSNVSVKITNQIGQVISNTEYQNTSSIKNKIEGVSGVYLIQVTTDEGKSASFKVQKQ